MCFESSQGGVGEMDPCARQGETAPTLVCAGSPRGAGSGSSEPLPGPTEGEPACLGRNRIQEKVCACVCSTPVFPGLSRLWCCWCLAVVVLFPEQRFCPGVLRQCWAAQGHLLSRKQG